MLSSWKFFASLLIACQVIHLAHSVDQSLKYDVTDDGAGTFTVTFAVFNNDDTVNVVSFIDPATGEPSCTYSVADLHPTISTALFELPPATGNFKDALRVGVFTIDSSTDVVSVRGSTTSCAVLEDPDNAGDYMIYIHAKSADGATAAFDNTNDMQYIIETQGSGNNVRATSTRTDLIGPVVPVVTSISASTLDVTLTVVNPLSGDAEVSSLPLGNPAKLKLEFTINPYVAGLDISGVRGYSCYVDYVNTFDEENLLMMDSNGCMIDVDLFSNQDTTSGFIVSSNTPVDDELNFIAMTREFEVSAWEESQFGPRTLYFKCSILYCFEPSTICNGNQCITVNKRSDDVTDKHGTVVFASLNITNNKAAEADSKCEKCSESTTYFISTATFTTLITIAFGVMSFAFLAARRLGKTLARKTGHVKPTHATVPTLTNCSKNETMTNESKIEGNNMEK